MQCVILAAGRGVRMGALCNDTPKPMLPLQGKPKLAYTIEMLPEEITEVVLIVGYLKEKIMDFFGEAYKGKHISYVEQGELNGTGGAIHLVKERIRGKFLVVMGDDLYLKNDLKKLLQYDLAVLAMDVVDSSQFGALKTDRKGNLEAILERPHDPEYTLVNTAAYSLTPDFFRYPLVSISEKEYGLPQTMMQMRDKKPIVVVTASAWLPIGDASAYKEAQKRIKEFL